MIYVVYIGKRIFSICLSLEVVKLAEGLSPFGSVSHWDAELLLVRLVATFHIVPGVRVQTISSEEEHKLCFTLSHKKIMYSVGPERSALGEREFSFLLFNRKSMFSKQNENKIGKMKRTHLFYDVPVPQLRCLAYERWDLLVWSAIKQ